jgi:CheY-like chemotaxis protein
LNAVLGYGQILSNDDSIPANRKNAVSVVRRSAEHMSGLLDGLLDISKIESRRFYLRREEIDLSETFRQIVDMFRLQANTKGLEFRYSPPNNLPVAVYGDGRRLRQVLINLLSNAVKYTQRGYISLHIRYRNMFAEIEVSDSGVGIHPNDQARIFEPFERAQPAGPAIPGTGLGLTITKQLVEIMGGEISLKSVPGVGSNFRLRLLLSEASRVNIAPKKEGEIVGYAGQRRTIVVADDDSTHCDIVAEMLGPLGFTVFKAESGGVCLEIARDCTPDLVLLDVAMPGLSGWETAAALRQSISPTSRIIMISGNAFEIDAHRDAPKHYDAVHIKPFFAESLFQTIAELLRLEWILARAAHEPPTDRGSASEDLANGKLPQIADLADLRRLGEIGYVRGIREKLADLGARSSEYHWLVELLEPMSRSLDFPQYITTLTRLIEQEQSDEESRYSPDCR